MITIVFHFSNIARFYWQKIFYNILIMYKLAKDEAKVDLIYLIANKIGLYDDEEVSEYEALAENE